MTVTKYTIARQGTLVVLIHKTEDTLLHHFLTLLLDFFDFGKAK